MKTTLSMVLRKMKINPKDKKILSVFLVLLILALSLGTIQGTLGRFSRSFMLSDSAQVSKFDIMITAPEEFIWEHGENVFEYRFLSNMDIRVLSFQIYNNGETDIICTPHISGGIKYRVYILGTEVTEFIVQTKETVSFELLIGPEGLDTNVRDAELFMDIRQMEGG